MITFIKDLLASVVDTIKSLWNSAMSIFKTDDAPKEETKPFFKADDAPKEETKPFFEEGDFYEVNPFFKTKKTGSGVVMPEAKCQEEIKDLVSEVFDTLGEGFGVLEQMEIDKHLSEDPKEVAIATRVHFDQHGFRIVQTAVAKLYGTENVSKKSMLNIGHAVNHLLCKWKSMVYRNTHGYEGIEGNPPEELKDVVNRLIALVIKTYDSVNSISEVEDEKVDAELALLLGNYDFSSILDRLLEEILAREKLKHGS